MFLSRSASPRLLQCVHWRKFSESVASPHSPQLYIFDIACERASLSHCPGQLGVRRWHRGPRNVYMICKGCNILHAYVLIHFKDAEGCICISPVLGKDMSLAVGFVSEGDEIQPEASLISRRSPLGAVRAVLRGSIGMSVLICMFICCSCLCQAWHITQPPVAVLICIKLTAKQNH